MSEPIFITIPLGMLQEPFTKVAISLPELVQQTNAFSVKHRPGCIPQLLSSNPKELYLKYNVKCKESYSDPAGHTVQVKFDVTKVEQTQQAKDLDVQVNCSCPAFLYWGAQWNLHQRDGLFGEPRPLLQAPTERLDLRGNFVICKHCKAVFERILPSVQHNIVKLLRERTVRENKEKYKTPDKLQKKLDEMKERQQQQKERGKGNKEIQDKLQEALRQRELEKNPEAENIVKREPGSPAVIVETPKKEDVTMERPITPKDMQQGPEDISDLLAEEERKLHQQQEKQHQQVKQQPHLHEGLPYETDSEKKDHGHKMPSDRELLKTLKQKKEQPNEMKNFLDQKYKRKRTSLEASLLASIAEEDEDESGD